MHRALSSRWLSTALRTAERPALLELPVYLCPILGSRPPASKFSSAISSRAPQQSTWTHPHRSLQTQADAAVKVAESPSEVGTPSPAPIRKLPAQCTGCGALSQTTDPNLPGYYDLSRKVVKMWLGQIIPRAHRIREEAKVYHDALKSINRTELEKMGLDMKDIEPSLAIPEPESRHQEQPLKKPLCDRCHMLLHHQEGIPIFHPTMDSIRDTIDESPYKYNHVYHILDAADFPMSILPQIHRLLDLMPLRTKNRRARDGKFYHGQKTELSFVVTRSDLLAPTKAQVDRLVPYLREVLREALGRNGSKYRLGNLRCVSAKRSWWTKELKEEIWKRGGAGWMVGKVNVGKSQLFEAVFPKGRMDWDPSRHQITVDMYKDEDKAEERPTETDAGPKELEGSEDAEGVLIEQINDSDVAIDSLLPPAAPETQYPDMPLVSSLPGTTASPIRIPFGSGRGELIDLPGLERTGLEKHVQEAHRHTLVMRSRIVPTQQVLKQGQSLLLGGFIRITPRVPGPMVLSYAFTPLEAHLTSTEKAVEIQEQRSMLNVENIAVPGTGDKIKLAGSFPLKWDVTKQRAGPITARDAVAMKVDRLPYRVLGADILIEGVGWVEVDAQVRVRDLYSNVPSKDPTVQAKPLDATDELGRASALERLEALAEDPQKNPSRVPSPHANESEPPNDEETGAEPELNWPIIDVYSPEGKFIGIRRPMNGWLLNKPKLSKAAKRSRPRRSMKGVKKLEKKRRREREAAAGAGAVTA